MPERKSPVRKLSVSNTKQDMLTAYNELAKQLQELRETELKPEEKIEEKAAQEAMQVADSLSTEAIAKEAGNLKSEVGKLLTQLSDRLEEEIGKYNMVKKAVEAKQRELEEIYEIRKSASSLAALLESQHIKREEFESEMASRKEELSREIQVLRAEWEKEKKQHEAENKERDQAELKKREREKEEYRYVFAREQQVAKDQFEDEKAKLERDIQYKKEQMEKELAEREKVIAQKEEELSQLRARVEAFPKDMEAAVNKAAKEATERIRLETTSKEELLKKEFSGERNVLTTRIESLELSVKEQSEQIAKLSQQLERAYSQIQDVAVKTIEGSSNVKSLASLQQLITDQTRRQS